MRRDELQALLNEMRNARIGVLGDFCLDIYWIIDQSASEPSIETGKPTMPVHTQRYSLGGAGNVAANLVALGCVNVAAFGVLGNDPWGRELRRLLRENGVDTHGMVVQQEQFATLAYTKPHLGDEEQSRLDFGNYNWMMEETAASLVKGLNSRLGELDILIINQQVKTGIHSRGLRQRVAKLIEANPKLRVVVDSRHFPDAYPTAILKLNDQEAMRMLDRPVEPGAMVLKRDAEDAARTLFDRFSKPVFLTRGDRGVVVCDKTGLHTVPGIQVLGRVDSVGAGDSMLAGIAGALAAGATPLDAARLGNIAASITIRKLHQTGTASPDEVMDQGADPDYVWRPELADDPRHAIYLPDSEIECIGNAFQGFRARHVIFDHDGTLSTLRQGWEAIMEPMMTRAILGPQYATADEAIYHRVVAQVRQFIDQTTGIQTLYQMQGLIKLVKEFGCVPEAEILDEYGYKAIYNEALLDLVKLRLAKLRRGELAVDDFVMKNAVQLLRALHAAGCTLYLASGTDQEDVEFEARALGYADLFAGGIHGANRDISREAKRVVLDRIMRDLGSDGASVGLVTFGDGPVEIRETRKRDGLAIGIASDELRRFGLNPAKRSRLIRAGADLVIPDFSQLDRLLPVLGL